MTGTLTTLPPAVRDQLHLLLRRIRLGRWLRGLGTLIAVAVFLFAAAFCTDRAIGLSNQGLRLWVLALVLGVAAAALVGIMRLSRPLEPRTLAGLVETRYPDLDECLSSAVELMEQPRQAHGAAALVAIVCQDAARKTAALDMAPVFPLVSARRRLGWALALLGLAAAPLLVSPAYAAFGQRFVRCWLAPLVGYRIEVTPGDAMLARGRPASITVRLVSEDERVPLPKACALLVMKSGAAAERHSMQAQDNEFTYTLEKLPGNLSYRIEAGELVSETFRVQAIEPVELVQGFPRIEITPPPYVNTDVHPLQTVANGSDFSALQFSRIRFDFRFQRVPVGVRVRWHKATADSPTAPVLHWGPSKNEAFVELPAAAVGTFSGTLLMEAEHGIMTEQALSTWKVWPDEPPVFTQHLHIPSFSGQVEDVRPVAAHEAIPLRATAEDQVGLGRVEVEVRINDGPSMFEQLADGGGQRQVHSAATFKLVGKVKEGDTVRLRLRAADNRRMLRNAVAANVPEHDLTPQVSHEPARKDGQDRWVVFKVKNQADPLQQQEIVAQRDDVFKTLQALQKKLQDERAHVEKTHAATHGQPFLTSEALRHLGQARAVNKEVVRDLVSVGRKALDEPALLALGERAFAVAQNEMASTDQHLAKAGDKQVDAAVREEHLKQADLDLSKALARLDELTRLNERLAQDRLDRMRIDDLARRQEELARRLKEVAALNRQDSMLQKELALLRAEQDKIARELERLTEESRLFKESLQTFRAAEAKALARKARELAQGQRDLNGAGGEALAQELTTKLAELAKMQADLAGRAEQLGMLVSGKRAQPHFPDAQAAAAALKQAKGALALNAQAKAQQDLLNFAGALESSTPKVAPEEAREKARQARTLAREQQELAESVRKTMDAHKAQAAAREKELEKATQKLTDDLLKLAQQAAKPESMHSAKEAAQAAGDAQKAQGDMKKEGDVDKSKELAKDAALKLELAADKAEQAADKMAADANAASDKEARDMAGKALQEGQVQVEKAQNQLKDGASSAAEPALQRAAQALQNAAQAAARQMAAANQGALKSLTAGKGGATGPAGSRLLPPEMESVIGKRWGELPGELRTRLLQDMRARYGDEYAPIIQRYFQQIADVPAGKR